MTPKELKEMAERLDAEAKTLPPLQAIERGHWQLCARSLREVARWRTMRARP